MTFSRLSAETSNEILTPLILKDPDPAPPSVTEVLKLELLNTVEGLIRPSIGASYCICAVVVEFGNLQEV